MNLYNIARLHALSENKSEAWKWLQQALQAGFNYTYVLKNDPALKNLRKDAQWKKTIGAIIAKEYFSSGKLSNQAP